MIVRCLFAGEDVDLVGGRIDLLEVEEFFDRGRTENLDRSGAVEGIDRIGGIAGLGTRRSHRPGEGGEIASQLHDLDVDP